MKPLLAALLLALAPPAAADTSSGVLIESSTPHAFNVRDLVMMDRVNDPQLSPDGRHAAVSVRSTDYAANKGVNALYVLDIAKPDAEPVKLALKGASSPRWSASGRSLYYVAASDGVAQLWRLDFASNNGVFDLHAAMPVQVSHGPLDVDDYKLSPDGKSVLLSYAVFTDCSDLACTKERLDGRAKDKSTGTLYQKLFVRHWDTWADGRRSQLYIAHF